MLLLIVRIITRSLFIVVPWAVLQKRAELIWASLSHGPGTRVVIVGDMGCAGAVGELSGDEEVFVDGIVIQWKEKVCIRDEDIMNFIHPEREGHNGYQGWSSIKNKME
jgi:hypothetical protein